MQGRINMTHHELTVENKELKEQTMTDMQKDLIIKLINIVFMDWKEEWSKGRQAQLGLGPQSGIFTKGQNARFCKKPRK